MHVWSTNYSTVYYYTLYIPNIYLFFSCPFVCTVYDSLYGVKFSTCKL